MECVIMAWLICAFIGAVLAGSRNVNPFGGFMLGLLLGPIGLVIVAVLGINQK